MATKRRKRLHRDGVERRKRSPIRKKIALATFFGIGLTLPALYNARLWMNASGYREGVFVVASLEYTEARYRSHKRGVSPPKTYAYGTVGDNESMIDLGDFDISANSRKELEEKVPIGTRFRVLHNPGIWQDGSLPYRENLSGHLALITFTWLIAGWAPLGVVLAIQRIRGGPERGSERRGRESRHRGRED